ncbi:MAG: transposase [Bacteroidales bacterium]|nr:transposase [Bacteroidales bacterium]
MIFFIEIQKGGNKNRYHKDYFVYEADRDIYICPQAKELVFEKEEQKTTATGFMLTLKRYRANACSKCKFKKQCTKSEFRTVQRIEDFEKHKKNTLQKN